MHNITFLFECWNKQAFVCVKLIKCTFFCSDYVTVKCGGESEIDIELKKDGSLALSSLKALYECNRIVFHLRKW